MDTNLCVDEAYIYNEILYGLNYKYGALVFCDLKEEYVKKIIVLKKQNRILQFSRLSEMYHHLIVTDNYAFILEYHTNQIIKVELKTFEQNTIELSIKKQVVSFIGISEDRILLYAVETGEIITYSFHNNFIIYNQVPEKCIGIINAGAIRLYDKKVYFTGYMKNIIIKYDLEKDTFSNLVIDGVENDICLCEKYKGGLLLITQEELIFLSGQHIDKSIYLHFEENNLENLPIMPFYNLIVIEDKLFLFPFKGKDFYIINLVDMTYKKNDVNAIPISEKKTRSLGYFGVYMRDIYGINKEGKNVIFNIDSNEFKQIDFATDKNLLSKVEEEIFELNDIFSEEQYTIFDLLGHTHHVNRHNSNIVIGQQIHNIMKR